MADASSTPPNRLLRVARTVAGLARRLMFGVAILTAASAAAGLLLWGVVWGPWPTDAQSVVLAGGGLIVLLAPAAVLGLFYVGLRDLLALPERLSAHTTRTVERSVETARTVAGAPSDRWLARLWHAIKNIWALRSVLQENRGLLLRYGALLRFLTPGFLLLVGGAAVVSLLLIPVAVVSGALAWLL